MCVSTLTRRQLVRYGALVGATFGAARLPGGGVALAQAADPSSGRVPVPMNLELVTVSDTYAVITWFTGDPTALDEFQRPLPVKAPGRVLIGTSPDPRTWVEVGAHGPTAYHAVEVTGLVPGGTYFWAAESNGVPATPTVVNPRNPLDGSAPPRFTTLVPPGGRELGRVAWLNDLHFGEQFAGLITTVDGTARGGLPPGFPVDPDHPYWRFMSQAAVLDARARGCDLLLANGDLSNEAEPPALAECRSTLDGFGRLGGVDALRPGDVARYFVTRGNHDRAHGGELYAACSSRGELNDCHRDVFAAGYEPGTTHFSVRLGDETAGYRFVGLDSNDGSDTGVLRQGELDYLEAQLQRGDLVVPLFHHPASDLAARSQLPPGGAAGLNPADAERFRAVLGRHLDRVGGVYAGHTHRNARDLATGTGTVPFFEGGAVKEYPGGWTLVRLYEQGYLVTFHKTVTEETLAWSERSRGAYFGLAPNYQLGGLSDRNWSYAVDARRRTPLAAAAPAPAVPQPTMDGASGRSLTTGQAAGGRSLPATGAGGAALAGAVLGTAGLVAGLAARSAAASSEGTPSEGPPSS